MMFFEKKNVRGHTDLNHGPIGLQPIALPLSYIPNTVNVLKILTCNYNIDC